MTKQEIIKEITKLQQENREMKEVYEKAVDNNIRRQDFLAKIMQNMDS